MTVAEQHAVVEGRTAAPDSHDLVRYLAHLNEDAVLDDPLVGRQVNGHEEPGSSSGPTSSATTPGPVCSAPRPVVR